MNAPRPFFRRRLLDWLAATGGYLWGGWGSLASLCLFLAAWDLTAQQLGSLILPPPQATSRMRRGSVPAMDNRHSTSSVPVSSCS